MVTQATISRDIRELGLIKVTGSTGKYKYALPRREQVPINSKFRNLLIETVTGLDSANNIAVVKTCSGMAPGAAAAIDSMSHNDIVGSVAGYGNNCDAHERGGVYVYRGAALDNR